MKLLVLGKITNIFCVGAIHQLHQVEIAAKYFSIEGNSALVLIMDVNYDTSIAVSKCKEIGLKSVVFQNWTFKDLLKPNGTHKRFIDFVKSIKQPEMSYNLYMGQYTSDYTLLLNSILKPNKFFLIDEGTASYNFQRIRESKNKSTLKNKLKSILYGYSVNEPLSITYFTKYNITPNLKDDEIIKYKENQIKNSATINPQRVIYVGGITVEMGFMTTEEYLNFLELFANRYKGKTLEYMAHRAENAEKLKQIEKMGFQVTKQEITFEQWYKSQKEIPEVIASHFYASTLGNLAEKFEVLPEVIGYTDEIFNKGGNDQVRTDIFDYLKSLNRISFLKLNHDSIN